MLLESWLLRCVVLFNRAEVIDLFFSFTSLDTAFALLGATRRKGRKPCVVLACCQRCQRSTQRKGCPFAFVVTPEPENEIELLRYSTADKGATDFTNRYDSPNK